MASGISTVACIGAFLFTCPISVAFQSIADSPVAIAPRARRLPVGEIQPILRVDSCLVQIPTHVTTVVGGSVTTLIKEDFRLFEDGVEQKLSAFSHDDAPLSIGVLFDTSGSMKKQNKMQRSAEAAAAFFRTASADDEFFLIKFSGKARLAAPFTTDSAELYKEILHTKPAGQTSLLDAIHLALIQMKAAKNLRKALVIVSDGGDNWSRHTAAQLRNALIESDVQVYAMGIFDSNYSVKHSAEEQKGPQLLDELAEQTGGRHYPVENVDDLPAIATRLGRDLRDQYVLGYYSSNLVNDGKYRQVKLNLLSPEALHLRAYYRRGYYSPAQ